MIDNPTDQFPSVPVAYELSLRAVDISIRRYDNQDANLERIITWITTVTTTLLTFVASGKIIKDINYESPYFILGVILAVLSLTIAFIAKFSGEISTTNPKKLYEDAIEEEEIEFKKDHIYYFGQDCDQMDAYTRKKWLFGVIAILLFSLELMFFVIWISKHTTS